MKVSSPTNTPLTPAANFASRRPTPEQIDQFRKSEEAGLERWSGEKLGQGLLLGGLAGAGLGGAFAAISNPSLGLTVAGSAIICGCLGASIGGCLAKWSS